MRHHTRRSLLKQAAAITGLSMLDGASLLEGAWARSTEFSPQVAGKAKRVIFLFMFGGPSQMDLFDYKPELQRAGGKRISLERRRGKVEELELLASRRSFRQFGETGQWCSDAFQHLPAHMDKLAVIKSLYTDSFAHGSAVLQLNSGQTQQGHPALGAWLAYGMGSANDALPPFVVMHDPRGGPISGPANWTSGYMPASHQGTLFRSSGAPVLNLRPARGSARDGLTREMEREQLEAIHALNALHGEARAEHEVLRSRDATYDLAYRMQETAPEALDLSTEDPETLAMYGIGDPAPEHRLALPPGVFGRQCLIARRLIERDVRCVQIYHGGGHQQQTWDAHHSVEENLAIHCPEVDRPIAGLLTDLERRGLLEDTLVVWGGEFGRQPANQAAGDGQVASAEGRDHNPKANTMWLAGAGVKPGSYGETDDLGREAAVRPHHLRDLHATILHLCGLDHERLTYRFGGLDRKLTGVLPAEPIHGVLA